MLKSLNLENIGAASKRELPFVEMDALARNQATEIRVEKLRPYNDQPFDPYTPEDMDALVESIQRNGLLTPIIVQPISDGEYKILAGHNRAEAMRRLGEKTIPAIIKDVSSDEAELIMLDTNLDQRHTYRPSVLAKAYAMRAAVASRANAAKTNNIDRKTVYRYMRLNELTPELLQSVDDGIISIRAAVNISYLKEEEMKLLPNYIEQNNQLSIEESERLRKTSETKGLELSDLIPENASRTAKNPPALKAINMPIPADLMQNMFEGFSKKEALDKILEILEDWYKRRT